MDISPMQDISPTRRRLRCILYLRISKDKKGLSLGVTRQDTDLRVLAARNNWDIVAVLCDNDLSAHSGKRRPDYERLLEMIKNGEGDIVATWNHDRLIRLPRELEHYIDVCEPHDMATYTVQAGHYDLSTPSGRAVARTLAAWAKYEVEMSTERVKAAKLQAAKAGKFDGGQRPYGYLAGCKGINEAEAVIVRELIARTINGWSFNQLAIDLNKRGITTQHGRPWNGLKVRNILTHKRYAGVREHNGNEYDAQWPAIVDLDTWEQLQAAIASRRSLYKQRGPARKFLLTGFTLCGRCGQRMNTKPKQQRDGTYRTQYVCYRRDNGTDLVGCGGVCRLVAPVDLLISEAIIYRLETDAFDAALAGSENPNADLKELLAQQRRQAERLQEIRDDYATGELEKKEYQNLLATAQLRLDDLSQQVDRLTASTSVAHLPRGHRAREAWESSTLIQKRHIIETLIESVVIMPSPAASSLRPDELWEGYKFVPADVKVAWLI